MNKPLNSTAPHRALLWIAFLSFASMGLNGGTLGVAWLQMQASFGKSLESLGIILLASTLGALIISFYGGRIIAQIGVGMFCFLGALIGSLSLLFISLTPFWAGLVAATFFQGIGRAGINTGINTFIAQAYPVSRMNWLHAIFGLGSTLGPLLFTLLVIDLGQPWQVSYRVLLIVHALVALLFFLTIKHWRLNFEGAAQSQKKIPVPSMRSSLQLLPVWLGVTLFISHTGMQMSAGQLSNNLFVEGRGIDPKLAGIWISLFWAFITLGRLVFGALIDRLGTARVLRACTFSTVIGALLIWWNPADAVSFFGLALMGFTLAPVFPSSVSRTPRLVGAAHSPNAIGYQMAGAALGGAVLPGIVGYLGDNFSLELIPPAMVVIALSQFFLHEALSLEERRQLIAVTH